MPYPSPRFMIPHPTIEQIHNTWQFFFNLPTASSFEPLNLLKLRFPSGGFTTEPMSQGGEITAPSAATCLSWEVTLSYFWSNWHLCNQNPSPDLYPVSKHWLWVCQQQNPKHRGFYCTFSLRALNSYPHWKQGSKTEGKTLHPKGQRRRRARCCIGWFSLFSSI